MGTSDLNEGLGGRRALRAGILLGLIAGIADAIAVLIENPNSFTGLRSPAAFIAASVAMHLVLGAAIGGLLALTGLARRISATTFFAIGFGLFLFLWIAIRVHVRWFFGEPLTSMKSLPAYAGVFVAAVIVAAVLVRVLQPLIHRGIDALRIPILSGILFAVLLLIVLGKAPRPAPAALEIPPDDLPDILLVTLDTTRADHLSCYGYPRGTTPAIDRLARNEGLVFENAYSSIPLTNPSHVSLFTNLSPSEHGVLNNGTPYTGPKPTFVETLAYRGYRCAAFVSGIPLKSGLSGLDRGFVVYNDSFSIFDRLHPMMTSLAIIRAAHRVVPTQFVERSSRATVHAAIEWLQKTEGRRFLWVHLYDAHSPYNPPAVMQTRFQRESQGWSAQGKPVTEWPIANYDAEIREMDRNLEDLLREFIRPTATNPDTRLEIVITADHGEGLDQHGELTHGQLLYEEDLRVPLVYAEPSLAQIDRAGTFISGGGVQLAFTSISTFRIGFPLRSELTRSSPSSSADSLQALETNQGFRAWTFAPEGRETKAAWIEKPVGCDRFNPVRGRKLIVNYSTGDELGFDLEKDPGETQPIQPADSTWTPLRNQLVSKEMLGETRLDPEVERRLRSLGYIHD